MLSELFFFGPGWVVLRGTLGSVLWGHAGLARAKPSMCQGLNQMQRRGFPLMTISLAT